MSGNWPANALPNLPLKNHSITSPATRRYNCIAWAVGIVNQWWWPINLYYWPSGDPMEETVEAFSSAFASRGYEECEDGSLEPGYRKIVLFARQDDSKGLVPTHAARQLENGQWTSKLGQCEDIMHVDVENVSCPGYGKPVLFMRRPM